MLKSFEVKGYRNFDDPLRIDFSDVYDYSFNKDCLKDNLLKTTIVYGKNATGKTNIGLAIFDLCIHLSDSAINDGVHDDYLNGKSMNEYARFDYTFKFKSDEIKYSYQKTDEKTIIFESLSINGALYFEYTVSEDDAHNKKKEFSTKSIDNTYDTNSTSLFSLRYVFDHLALAKKRPLTQLKEYVSSMVWFKGFDDSDFVALKEIDNQSSNYYTFMFKDENLTKFQGLLKTAGIKEKLTTQSTTENTQELVIQGKPTVPFFEGASRATKGLYDYFYLSRGLNISFLFFDHFDSHYHFKLAEIIADDLKQTTFQSMLISHNTSLLSNKIYRADCYFILFPTLFTSLAAATTRLLKEKDNLKKLYMNGEFNQKG